MKNSNLNEYEVYDLIDHEVCLQIQASVWHSIDGLIYNSSFDAVSIKHSTSDLIRDPEDIFEDYSICDMIYKLNEKFRRKKLNKKVNKKVNEN
jgi:hypothetical protein